MPTSTIKIDTSQIPNFRRVELALGARALTKEVFACPGEEERYQVWLKKRNAAKAARREVKS